MTNCPPYITMGLLIELLPSKHPMSVYRYNTAKAKAKRLPAPDVNVGGVSLWSVETIQGWADSVGLELDRDRLAVICQSQMRG